MTALLAVFQSIAGMFTRATSRLRHWRFAWANPLATPSASTGKPEERFKRSAIPYAGYEYQTLQGVRLLAAWLAAPTRYRRVRFEADADVAPQGLDDIVCERDDGRFDYLQVKFSPSPDKAENQLTWDWLLEKNAKRPKAKSLARKWFDALKKIPLDSIGEVTLLTNRVPDATLGDCMVGEHLDYARAPADVQQRLCDELEGEISARVFLQRLRVQHSDKSYLTLGREVREALRKFTDEAGVHRLRSHAREWAIFQRHPFPDGWITLEVVRALLSMRRPEPIPEDFAIPKDYAVPASKSYVNPAC